MTENDVSTRELADHVRLHELRSEFTDAAMTNDHDRFVALFVADGALRIPAAGVEAAGHDQLRALCEQREANFELFVQAAHPGTVEVDGDTASGRAVLSEFIRLKDGTTHRNWAIYHDRFVRTVDGWRFVERRYEIRHLETTGPSDVTDGVAELS